MKICIDAGHNYSGFDTGASGNGLREQDITFKIADKLKELLVKTNVGVTMTRAKITDIVGKNAKDSINERARVANTTKCDYFVSIHCNSSTSKSASGTETLVCGRGGKAETLAKYVTGEIANHFGIKNRSVKVDTEYLGYELGVLHNTNMPAILIETAFISNKKDAELLKNYVNEFAECIYKGICEFLGYEAVALKKKHEHPVDIIEKLSKEIEIHDKKKAVFELEEAKAKNMSLYWLLYKIANKE